MEDKRDVAIVAAESAAVVEIKSAITIAKQCPRNEYESQLAIIKSLDHPSFSLKSIYRFPRGGAEVSGPSVYFAREMARLWGNMRHGVSIITDSDDDRIVEGWAWDVETNTKVSSQSQFKKLIQRKGQWIRPDERDLRELTNKHGAICVRNSLLQLFPDYIVQSCIEAAKKGGVNAVKKMGASSVKQSIVDSFNAKKITIVNLEKYIGVNEKNWNEETLANLQAVLIALDDGQLKRADIIPSVETPAASEIEVKKSLFCTKCNANVTKTVFDYSEKKLGVALCMGCQKNE